VVKNKLNRIGKFKLSTPFLEYGRIEIIEALFSKMIPISVYREIYSFRGLGETYEEVQGTSPIVYIAHSSLFDIYKLGDEIPEYAIIIKEEEFEKFSISVRKL